MVTCFACSSTNKLSIPFSAEGYQSTSDYVRAVSHGESENSSIAERMAIHNAQTELSVLIQTLVKNVSSEFNSKYAEAEWSSYFQKEEISISQQTMSQLKVVEKKEVLRDDKRYEFWVVVELPRSSLMEHFDRIISASKVKNLEEGKQHFQEVFQDEWAKLVNK